MGVNLGAPLTSTPVQTPAPYQNPAREPEAQTGNSLVPSLTVDGRISQPQPQPNSPFNLLDSLELDLPSL